MNEPKRLENVDLVEFEARMAAATRPPWRAVLRDGFAMDARVERPLGDPQYAELHAIKVSGGASYCGGDPTEGLGERGPTQDFADARFIEAARNIGPEVCREVRHQRHKIEALEAKVERLEKQIAEAQERAKAAGQPDPMVDPALLAYVNWGDLGDCPNAPPEVRLFSLMTGISEDRWCAGWDSGLENWLWRAVEQGLTSDGQGHGAYPTPAELALLKSLSAEAGGWLVWDAGYQNPDPRLEFARLVPMAEWLKVYAAHQRNDALAAEQDAWAKANPGKVAPAEMPDWPACLTDPQLLSCYGVEAVSHEEANAIEAELEKRGIHPDKPGPEEKP
jgi:hypothetical protein